MREYRHSTCLGDSHAFGPDTTHCKCGKTLNVSAGGTRAMDDSAAAHPAYGPCDGFGPKGGCSECSGVIERVDGVLLPKYGPRDEAIDAPRDRPEHFAAECAARCQYAEDVSMGGCWCSPECMYLKSTPPADPSAENAALRSRVVALESELREARADSERMARPGPCKIENHAVGFYCRVHEAAWRGLKRAGTCAHRSWSGVEATPIGFAAIDALRGATPQEEAKP